MKKIYIILILSLAAFLSACDKDETSLPEQKDDINYFAVPDEATDVTSVYRKDFYKRTGIYLMLNDTLRHDYWGVDAQGETVYLTETIDLSYSLTGLAADKYYFDYIPSLESSKNAIQFIESDVLSTMDKSLHPYSMLIVDVIKRYNGGKFKANEIAVTGMRSTGISVKGFDAMSSTDREKIKRTIRFQTASKYFGRLSSADLQAFTAPVLDKYGTLVSDDDKKKDPRVFGFLAKGSTLPGKQYFQTQQQDMNSFLPEMFNKTQVEFEQAHGTYPIIMQRYRALLNILKEGGFSF